MLWWLLVSFVTLAVVVSWVTDLVAWIDRGFRPEYPKKWYED